MATSRTEPAHDNIVLIGMPGVGKSTVGVVLAKIMNYDFVDADLLIQQRCDKTLQRLIDSLGPDGFIAVEGQVLSDMDFDRTIISTGGSAVYSHDAMLHLRDIGRVVYLKIDIDELTKRLPEFSERGVVMRHPNAMSLSDLYEERSPLYEEYADLTVDVSNMDITAAAQKVIAALSE